MGALTERNVIVVFLATIFAASFFVACNPDETPIEPPATMTISGKVLDLIAQASPGTVPPIAGATLEVVSSDPDSECRCECLDDGSEIKTISDQDGNWTLKDVPLTYDPSTYQANSLLIKITAAGYNTAHSQYTATLGDKSDVMIMSKVVYFLMYALYLLYESDYGFTGADPDELCLMMGAAIGFSDMDYPPKTVPLEGVTGHATGGSPPEEFNILYFGEGNMPDPSLNETSTMGAFLFVVPDATGDAAPVVTLSGTKPGASIVGGDFPACPGSFFSAGLIDPYFKP